MERAMVRQGAYPDAAAAEASDPLHTLVQVTRKVTGEPLVEGNDATPLVDGPATFREMFSDIGKARHHIHLETFILEDDRVGDALADLLIERRRAGVSVRIIVDAFGSRGLASAYLDRLRDEGIEVYVYHPLDPLEDARFWRYNHRDHRKILIVDGKVAYVGGINISSVYSRSSISVRNRAVSMDQAWRDTHVRLSGPIVHRIQQRFLDTWRQYRPEEELSGATYFPPAGADGDMSMQLVAETGGNDRFTLYSVMLAAIRSSRDSVWITQGYFAPDKDFLDALSAAARRGVDVRLLLPGATDAPLVMYASRSTYERLLERNVRIFELTDTVLHAKTTVIDGVWTTIGSSNFDYRSFVYNNELNVVVLDGDFSRAMEKLYEVDLQKAHEITLAEWRERPLLQRFREFLGRLLRNWM